MGESGAAAAAAFGKVETKVLQMRSHGCDCKSVGSCSQRSGVQIRVEVNLLIETGGGRDEVAALAKILRFENYFFLNCIFLCFHACGKLRRCHTRCQTFAITYTFLARGRKAAIFYDLFSLPEAQILSKRDETWDSGVYFHPLSEYLAVICLG